jgi:hypothetical protein
LKKENRSPPKAKDEFTDTEVSFTPKQQSTKRSRKEFDFNQMHHARPQEDLGAAMKSVTFA